MNNLTSGIKLAKISLKISLIKILYLDEDVRFTRKILRSLAEIENRSGISSRNRSRIASIDFRGNTRLM